MRYSPLTPNVPEHETARVAAREREHDLLEKREGTWTATMKAGGMESRGAVNFKMGLGGLWLVGSMESDLGGQKFSGKSLDTDDPRKQKHVGVWFDSVSTAPLTMEGTYDKEAKCG